MNPLERNNETALLHPLFRAKAAAVLEIAQRERLPFRLFEGYRSPERQAFLWGQGRKRPGAIVTRAKPWDSYHQYGLAGDFVLFENAKWSWDVSGHRMQWWFRLHEIARENGLEALSFELPHLQIVKLKVSDLKAGKYPDAGDRTWSEIVAAARVRFPVPA